MRRLAKENESSLPKLVKTSAPPGWEVAARTKELRVQDEKKPTRFLREKGKPGPRNPGATGWITSTSRPEAKLVGEELKNSP